MFLSGLPLHHHYPFNETAVPGIAGNLEKQPHARSDLKLRYMGKQFIANPCFFLYKNKPAFGNGMPDRGVINRRGCDDTLVEE
jgi:hypothetical protein